MGMVMIEAGVLRMTSIRREAAAASSFGTTVEAAMSVEVGPLMTFTSTVHAWAVSTGAALSMMFAVEAAAGVRRRTTERRAAEMRGVTLRTAAVETMAAEAMAVRTTSLRAATVHCVVLWMMVKHPLQLIPAAASEVGLLRAGVGAARSLVGRGALPFRRSLGIAKAFAFRWALCIVRRSRAVFAHRFGTARVEARLELRLPRRLRPGVLLL